MSVEDKATGISSYVDLNLVAGFHCSFIHRFLPGFVSLSSSPWQGIRWNTTHIPSLDVFREDGRPIGQYRYVGKCTSPQKREVKSIDRSKELMPGDYTNLLELHANCISTKLLVGTCSMWMADDFEATGRDEVHWVGQKLSAGWPSSQHGPEGPPSCPTGL